MNRYRALLLLLGWLVVWGETQVDSGVAPIARATVRTVTLVLGWSATAP